MLPSSVAGKLGLYATSEFERGEHIVQYPGNPIPNSLFNEITQKCAKWKVKKEKNLKRVKELRSFGLQAEKLKFCKSKDDPFEYFFEEIDSDWSEIRINWPRIAETISKYSFGILLKPIALLL